MSQFFNQYFNFDVMGEHFGEVLEALPAEHPGLRRRRRPRADLGPVLALLRQLPSRKFAPIRFLTIAYIDVFRASRS